MSKEEREEVKLANKIRVFEDMILRSKNLYEIETIRNETMKMRVRLQNMQYQRLNRAQSLCSFLYLKSLVIFTSPVMETIRRRYNDELFKEKQ